MGIKNFYKLIGEYFNGAYVDVNYNNIYDYIYIDTNPIFHVAVYNSTILDDFKIFLTNVEEQSIRFSFSFIKI